MNLFRLLGIGSGRILAKDHSVKGTVTKISRCWWLSVRTKAIRLYASERNTAYPYIITFSYTVENVPHAGKLYIPVRYRVPRKGETIDVYYDPEKPQKYACYAFGPGASL